MLVVIYFSHPFTTEPDYYVTKQITSYPGSELFPAMSPDSQQVAFAWDGDGESTFHICIKYVDDAGPALQLTTGPNDDVSPVWSPNEHTLAFVRLADAEQRGVYTISMLGWPERSLDKPIRLQ
jgi:Tol biopolymer transport system component